MAVNFIPLDSLYGKETPLKEGVYWLMFADCIPVQYKIMVDEDENGNKSLETHSFYIHLIYRDTKIRIFLCDIPDLLISKEPVQYVEKK